VNINSSLMNELRNKRYREGYVGSQIGVNLPFQIRALRKERGLRQGELATLAKMAQPRISEIEKPGGRSLNLETLQRVAAGLDVGLQVRFIPFGELVDWAEAFDPDNFHVRSFIDEVAALGAAASSTSVLEPTTIPLEEDGPAGDDGREASGSEVFDPRMMPCVARPETRQAGTVELSR
jgi:transcriptional regulator with XRE-family HTH domain